MIEVTKTPEGLYAVKVDGREYAFEKWGAEAALDCLWDISSMVSAPLGALILKMFGQDGKGYQTDLTGDTIGKIVGELSANMRDNKKLGMSIFKRLAAQGVLCDGKQINFDNHYQDNLPHLFRVIRAAAEVQYGSFFGALQGVAGLRAATVPATST